MSEKTKIGTSSIEHLKDIALHPHFHMSVAFMGAATLMGVFDHSLRKPVMALEAVKVTYVAESAHHEEQRRDEVHPQHRGYGVAQRTPARSGSV